MPWEQASHEVEFQPSKTTGHGVLQQTKQSNNLIANNLLNLKHSFIMSLSRYALFVFNTY